MKSLKSSVSSSEPQPGAPQPGEGRRLRGWSLVTVMTGLFLAFFLAALDQTIVATALPKIVGELHGFSSYAWVATAYLLATATVIPIAGKLSDQFGRKWFLVGGIVLFLLGSALSGTHGGHRLEHSYGGRFRLRHSHGRLVALVSRAPGTDA